MAKYPPLPDKRQGQFGTVVRECRQCLGMSQEEFAARIGVKRSYLADVERGARNVSLQTIAKIADAAGISMSAIFRPLDVTEAGHLAEAAFAPTVSTALPELVAGSG